MWRLLQRRQGTACAGMAELEQYLSSIVGFFICRDLNCHMASGRRQVLAVLAVQRRLALNLRRSIWDARQRYLALQ